MGVRHPFRQDCHTSFQQVLARLGETRLLEVKRQVLECIGAHQEPSALSPPDDRFSRATLRIALRQIKMSGAPAPAIDAWLAAHDRAEAAEVEEEHPCTA